MINYLTEMVGMSNVLRAANSLQQEKEERSKPMVRTVSLQYEEEYSAFAEFMGQFGRSYGTFDDHMGKFDAFKVNYRSVKKHNSKFEKGEVTWKKAINQFSDMTQEEFEDMYLSTTLKKPTGPIVASESHHDIQGRPHLVGASHLPDYVNWFEAGKVSASIDQGGCGSCWAFTTATTLESLNAINNNLKTVPRYSVQYLLDCDESNWGCDGGWMADAYEFTKQQGIVDWEDYAHTYQGRKTKCSKVDKKAKRFHNGASHEEDMASNERMRELVAKNPIGVAIYSNYGCLGGYSSGIIHDKDCNCSNPDKNDVNHAVTLVGYGKSTEKGCDEYWIIKNSWGPYWGENGTFKLCADRAGRTEEFGTCQINSFVQWPSL